MVRKTLQGCNIAIFGKNPAWDHDKHRKIGGWLAHLSATYNANWNEKTTHLIVSRKRWTEDPRPSMLRKALAAIEDGSDLKIVTFEWLEDTLNSQQKKREAPYEWKKIDADAAKLRAKGKKAAEKETKKEAKSVPGLLSEIFHESTDKFVDPRDKEKMERRMERDKEARRQRELEEKEDKIRRRKDQAKIFARGAEKGRARLLSDNYHIYTDTTGFKYDVLVTKIDVRQNRNERWALTLQLFESNDTPTAYAMNAQFSGTSVATANNTICAIGSPLPTAMHAFKCEFLNRTGIEWDARLSTHVKGLRQAKIDRGIGTGSPAPGSTKGAPVSESAVRETPFEAKKFAYHPPGYGPKGEVTNEERKRLKALGLTVVDSEMDAITKKHKAPAVVPIESEVPSDRRADVMEWMKGADMNAVPPPTASDDMDFDAMALEDGIYPFEKKSAEPEQQETGQSFGEQIDNVGGDTGALDDRAADKAHTKSADTSDQDFDFDAPVGDVYANSELPFQTSQQPSTQEQSSMRPEVPSFITHPATEGTSIQHGTQEVGETQVADKVGGDFLEELDQSSITKQQPTPPASAKKAALGGTLNLRGSLLGKRKDVSGGGGIDGGSQKKAKVAEIDEGVELDF